MIFTISFTIFSRQYSLKLISSRLYNYSPVTPQTQSTGIIQLALALLFDLGLNRPVRDDGPAEIMQDAARSIPSNSPREKRRSIEERRAFLACFLLTST